MKRVVVLALPLIFGSCSSSAEREEERYAIVANEADGEATCAQARKVADAHLQERNQEAYKRWSLRARIACTGADLDKDEAGLGQADNLEMMADNATEGK